MKQNLYPTFPLLLVDDEPSWLRSMSIALARDLSINNVILCKDSREVLLIVKERQLSAVILDITMPYLTGEDLLPQIIEIQPELPVLMLSGRNQIEIAVRCMKNGAFDYFLKTDEEDRIMSGIQRALEFLALRNENAHLRASLLSSKLRHGEAFAGIHTNDSCMHDIFRYIEAIAASPEPVLITGESGTGKELIARSIHAINKNDGPWVAVNIAGLDDHAFSDTLFGHRRGAFTGATESRSGMIERAGKGVLFLDEIGDLSCGSQVKLLRVLQEREFYPLGGDQPARLQAKLVFATNHNLGERVEAGLFRRDLYHRLHAHHIHLPPLRERRNDIPLLLDHFLADAAKSLGKKPPTPPSELATLLRTYPFPGNLREFRSMVFDAVSRHERGILSMESFKAKIAPSGKSFAGGETDCQRRGLYAHVDRLPSIQEAIDELICEAMSRADGKISIAAISLGISRPALSKRLSVKDKPTA